MKVVEGRDLEGVLRCPLVPYFVVFRWSAPRPVDVRGDSVTLAVTRAETSLLIHPTFDRDTVDDAYLEAYDDVPKRARSQHQRPGRPR